VMNQHHLEWVFLHVGFVRKVDEKSEFSLPWRRDFGNGRESEKSTCEHG
jgi:hypothetical protein